MALQTLNMAMVGGPAVGIHSIFSLFNFGRFPGGPEGRSLLLVENSHVVSVPLSSFYSKTYPPDTEWRNWRSQKAAYLLSGLSEGQPTIQRREYVVAQRELSREEDPSMRDFYARFHVIAICFSVVDRESFNLVKDRWYPEIRYFRPDIPIVLVGTKTDTRLPESPYKSQVQYNDGLNLAMALRADYVECSAMTDRSSVEKVYQRLVWLGAHYIEGHK